MYRSIRIWLKRESGKYWPSVCHYAESILILTNKNERVLMIHLLIVIIATPSCLFYHAEPRRLFVGLDSGNILVRRKRSIELCQ